MMMKSQTMILAPFFLILVTSTQALEIEFSYMEGSEKGPTRWGELKPEWVACGNGSIQSPIVLFRSRAKVVPNSHHLNHTYKPASASILNRGHCIAVSSEEAVGAHHTYEHFSLSPYNYIYLVKWEGDGGSITIDGTHFHLRGAHWHSPSEHVINGNRYDMELHMVHQFTQPNGTNRTAVVAALYMLGPPDPFLSKLEESIKEIREDGKEKSVGVIHPSEIGVGLGHSYSRYIGSLTTPPCTQGVIWTISNQIRTVSREQVNLLLNSVQSYAKTNARPLQPLNNRLIQLHIPKPHKY